MYVSMYHVIVLQLFSKCPLTLAVSNKIPLLEQLADLYNNQVINSINKGKELWY